MRNSKLLGIGDGLMNIVFLRHGTIEQNVNGCYIGVSDYPLSYTGIQEIRKVKKLLKGICFDAVYSSPLKRAVSSAKILTNRFIIDERLKEMNFGIFEGLKYDEIAKKFPKELEKWHQNYIDFIIPQGENLRDMATRISSFMEDVSKTYRNILAVTHGGVIRCALCIILGNFDFFFKFRIDNASITIISIEKDFKYIKTINAKNELINIIEK